MAKKFLRSVTGVDDIEKFDKTLTNVNDLISDGQNTYVHTKKGKVESYYNLTNDVKEVKSADDSLTINKQDNTVTIANKTLASKQELATKQNTLTAGMGISLENNTISLIHSPQTTVDCNKIITTQYLKIGYNSTNLPKNVSPYGILSVVRISDVVEQIYQTHNGTGRFVRSCFYVDTNPQWSAWEQIITQPIS